MNYYFLKTVDYDFDTALQKIEDELKKEGFGILTDIDVQKTLKNKLNVDFRRYRILGACNPQFAHQALLAENKIGTMLPCNVVVQEFENGKVEIAAVDPVASMQAVENNALATLATQVKEKLAQVIEKL